jgi:hypothetical protein
LTCIIFIPRTNSRFLIQQRITGTTEASKRIIPGIEETKKRKLLGLIIDQYRFTSIYLRHSLYISFLSVFLLTSKFSPFLLCCLSQFNFYPFIIIFFSKTSKKKKAKQQKIIKNIFFDVFRLFLMFIQEKS